MRSRRAQCQRHDGDTASLRAPAIRRGPGAAFPDIDRDRQQSECRRGRRDRHRGGLDQARRRRDREDRQAGHRFRHRAARRSRHHHARLQGREGVFAIGDRKASGRMSYKRPLGVDQVRRVRHDFRVRIQSDRGQRIRQAASAGRHAVLRRDHGNHRRRVDCGPALRDAGNPRPVHVHVQPVPGRDQSLPDQRPFRIAADQGQHRRRSDDDRGKGARATSRKSARNAPSTA